MAKLKDLLENKSGLIFLNGVVTSSLPPLISCVETVTKSQVVIFVEDYKRGVSLEEDLENLGHKKTYLMPEETLAFFSYTAKSHELMNQKITCLNALLKGDSGIFIIPIREAIKAILPKSIFLKHKINLKVGMVKELETLKQALVIAGYEPVGRIEGQGQFSFRGDIIEVFSPEFEWPHRIEFFDCEIDSMRTFDLETYRSVTPVDELSIVPSSLMVFDDACGEKAIKGLNEAFEESCQGVTDQVQLEKLNRKKEIMIESIKTRNNGQLLQGYQSCFYEEKHTLLDYLKKNSVIIFNELPKLKEQVKTYKEEVDADLVHLWNRGEYIFKTPNLHSSFEEFFSRCGGYRNLIVSPFSKTKKVEGVLVGEIQLNARQPIDFKGDMNSFKNTMISLLKNGYRIDLFLSTENKIQGIKDFFREHNMESDCICLHVGTLREGWEFPSEKWMALGEYHIYGNAPKVRKKQFIKESKPIKGFSNIETGDFVVHEDHGIGKFLGIYPLEIEGVKREYFKIKYLGEDVLYIPIEHMQHIQKYIGGGGVQPKINGLGGTEWIRKKEKVQKAIENMAKELFELAALRQSKKGHAFGKDTPWQVEFEERFQYEETEGQLRAIEEIKKDMESEAPMDRLLCGDVGYGKTEVIMRAAFKCIADGKQAAILVPTTILAKQHYDNFLKRFQGFPIEIELLSRYRSKKQEDEIIEKLKRGQIDLVIGTHKLLSNHVAFKDLGLVVIDEEQRFGVKHKEKLKTLRTEVDIISLSATPIPRTLNLAMTGIKPISVIDTPVPNRYEVQTFVVEEDTALIRDVVLKELERGGQCFVVKNVVRGLEKTATELQSLIPEGKIVYAHGQMPEKKIEGIMTDFVEGGSDVLVATTIIENGIDIPNANTLIVLEADKLGLAQLYQLKGRVGRKNRVAYAYFSYKAGKVVTEKAEKRLSAIRDFTEFGSGFRIAMRDLEIRGAGNVLGTEQHGNMAVIGYELYCKLLEQAVEALGQEAGAEVKKEVQTDILVELEVSAFIPDTYIKDEALKVDFYKKIARVYDESSFSEIIDELIDRFSSLPKEVEALIYIGWIKNLCDALNVVKLYEKKGQITIAFKPDFQCSKTLFEKLIKNYGDKIEISMVGAFTLIYKKSNKENPLKSVTQLLELIKKY